MSDRCRPSAASLPGSAVLGPHPIPSRRTWTSIPPGSILAARRSPRVAPSTEKPRGMPATERASTDSPVDGSGTRTADVSGDAAAVVLAGDSHAHGAGGDSFRHSYSRDKAQLIRRLSRIEG